MSAAKSDIMAWLPRLLKGAVLASVVRSFCMNSGSESCCTKGHNVSRNTMTGFGGVVGVECETAHTSAVTGCFFQYSSSQVLSSAFKFQRCGPGRTVLRGCSEFTFLLRPLQVSLLCAPSTTCVLSMPSPSSIGFVGVSGRPNEKRADILARILGPICGRSSLRGLPANTKTRFWLRAKGP